MANSDVDGGHQSGRYPSDLGGGVGGAGTAEHRGVAGRRAGDPRKTDMRAAMDSILYFRRTAYRWRRLPRDSFPPRSTVYDIFRKVQSAGVRKRSRPSCI
jgi:hypothetical protein